MATILTMGYNGVSFVMELLTAVHESSTPVKDCVVCGWAKNDCFMTLLTGTKLLLFCFSSNVTTISTYSLVQDVSASLVLFCSVWNSAIDTVVLTSHVQKKTFKLRIILHCLFVVCGD